MDIKQLVAAHFEACDVIDLTNEQIYDALETPKHNTHGDIAFPCFGLAKKMRKSPQHIASELAPKLVGDIIEKTEALYGYINFFLKREGIFYDVINEILCQKDAYGSLSIGRGETVTIDWSSPNIAKPFSLGHLRSTVIGNAIALIGRKCGFTTLKINHLGDWGTQFGKLMVAYNAWGNEEKIKANPIAELLALYVHFHEEAENNKDLEQQGRDWFKKLEDGDAEATRLWQWFRKESLKAFDKIYDILGVSAEYNHGESFYNDKLDEIEQLLTDSNILETDKGAKIVRLDDENLPVCLVKKSDGASLYITRDLATALYRHRTFDFFYNIYVTGSEQTLHFKQLKAVLKKLGCDWAEKIIHTPFGMVRQGGKKLSTRKGKIVLLEEVLNQSIQMAKEAIIEKNPSLANKEIVAHQVGVGAVIFSDLHNERINDIDFDLDKMLKFEGETGPYLQYTNARANSILKKSNFSLPIECALKDDYSFEIIKLLAQFPQIIERAWKRLEPSVISKYIIDLAQSFNSYYGNVRILEEDEELNSRFALLKAVTIVLTEGMRLLGINAPEKM